MVTQHDLLLATIVVGGLTLGQAYKQGWEIFTGIAIVMAVSYPVITWIVRRLK